MIKKLLDRLPWDNEKFANGAMRTGELMLVGAVYIGCKGLLKLAVKEALSEGTMHVVIEETESK